MTNNTNSDGIDTYIFHEDNYARTKELMALANLDFASDLVTLALSVLDTYISVLETDPNQDLVVFKEDKENPENGAACSYIKPINSQGIDVFDVIKSNILSR
jgi:hypothetical protein